MRPAYVIAGFASLTGIIAVGMGLYGLYNLDFTEWAVTMGRAFEELPSRLSAWVWLAVSATIFLASLFAFRSRWTGAAL